MRDDTQRWIAIDWGTSRLRASLMQARTLLDMGETDQGMGQLAPAAFEPTLLSLISSWLDGPVDVLICGTAGARGGWQEIPYAPGPIKPADLHPMSVPTQDARLKVRIVPGVMQTKPKPDVMRGEETQITGFLTQYPSFDGILCLPGTHTKWVHVSAEEIISFQTFMTGEMFALLSGHSLLRHSVAADGWDAMAFETGLADTISRPETLAAALFGVRAGDLLEGLSPGTARARLSGLLIGAELAAARPYWLGQQVALIGDRELCTHYAAALAAQGVPTDIYDGADMTRLGLAHYLDKAV